MLYQESFKKYIGWLESNMKPFKVPNLKTIEDAFKGLGEEFRESETTQDLREKLETMKNKHSAFIVKFRKKFAGNAGEYSYLVVEGILDAIEKLSYNNNTVLVNQVLGYFGTTYQKALELKHEIPIAEQFKPETPLVVSSAGGSIVREEARETQERIKYEKHKKKKIK